MKAKAVLERQKADCDRELVDWPRYASGEKIRFKQLIEIFDAIVEDIEKLNLDNHVLRARIEELEGTAFPKGERWVNVITTDPPHKPEWKKP